MIQRFGLFIKQEKADLPCWHGGVSADLLDGLFGFNLFKAGF